MALLTKTSQSVAVPDTKQIGLQQPLNCPRLSRYTTLSESEVFCLFLKLHSFLFYVLVCWGNFNSHCWLVRQRQR